VANDRTPPGLLLAGALLISIIAVIVAGASAATHGSATGVGWALVVWALLVTGVAAALRWRPGRGGPAAGSVRDGAVLLFALVLVAGAVVLLLR
jgi:hypothetical protein